MAQVDEIVWLRCQAQSHQRFSSQEERERVRCPGNQAQFLGVQNWSSQDTTDLPPEAQKMPEGSGYVYRCTTCKNTFYVLMGAKFF